MLEIKRIRALLGGLLASSTIMASVVLYLPGGGNQILAMSEIGGVELMTEKIKNTPLPAMTGVSQGFYAMHPGIDITAPLGSAIHPLSDGVVDSVDNFTEGYGRNVVVKQHNGLVSLYAHMGKIVVEEGQKVTRQTMLGEVGLTGRTTGPHLHLEIRKNGLPVNPLPYLQ